MGALNKSLFLIDLLNELHNRFFHFFCFIEKAGLFITLILHIRGEMPYQFRTYGGLRDR